MPATNELLQEGRYRISQPSTPNGEEKVFEAYDTVRNTNVVVREIPVKLNRVATVSQRESLKLAFANQAKALTEIEHESLIHVHDYFSEIDRQYLVTEAVEGENLRQLILSGKKHFSVGEVTAWADELLDALHYLHSRRPSIIHRNINPSNVTLHPSGKIKLVGVGVETGTDSEFASASADGDELHYSPMEQIWPGLDAASQKAITNNYDDRSERILKQPLDERSDIYSLGATLYFLVTGVEPVDPIERSIEMLDGKLDPLREPTKVDANIPPEISDVLMKAMEIKRENRYDSAVIMRQVLKTAITRIQEREAEEGQQAPSQIVTPAPSNEVSAGPSADEKAAQAEAAAKRLEAEAGEKRRAAEAEEQLRASQAKAEQQKQKELMKRQLQEAEAQRLLAERNAEAELLMREKEDSASAEIPAVKTVDDNLLEIPVAAEVVAYRDTTAVEEDELAAVLRELDEADGQAGPQSGARLTGQKNAEDDLIVFDSPLDLGTQEAPVSEEIEDGDIFTVPEKTGFSMPIPAIAGAVAVLVFIAAGAWFAMSGSSEVPKPEAVPTVQVTQPAPVVETPPIDTVASSHTDANPIAAETPTEQAAAAAPKAAPTPKPKKETAKVTPDKKKVTVDDLINDN
ncbi:MAG TPA: protein kinase [Pyrinomonadaceae bacterium]|nr:protein kinase [Pyrinomonadaceae bacterium]